MCEVFACDDETETKDPAKALRDPLHVGFVQSRKDNAWTRALSGYMSWMETREQSLLRGVC